MSTITDRKTLEEIETEIARRYNWSEQEKFWEHQARMTSWRVMTGIAAVAATLGGVLVGLFMFALQLSRL